MFENEDVILPDDFQEATPEAIESAENELESVETVEDTKPIEETEEIQEITEQPQKIKLKYNHEEQEVTLDEARELAQKGLNYGKIQQQAEQYQQQLDEIAQITGYSTTDELFQAMELAKIQQQDEIYKQAGIDPQAFNQLLENNPEIKYAREMRAKQESDQKFQKEANELFQSFPDLKPDQIPKEVWETQAQGVPLKLAYMQHDYNQLKSQVKVLKQNKTNEQKAPINGISTHGSENVTSEDDFLSGFNSI